MNDERKLMNTEELDRKLDAIMGFGDDNEIITITRKRLRLAAEDAEAHMPLFWLNIETMREA